MPQGPIRQSGIEDIPPPNMNPTQQPLGMRSDVVVEQVVLDVQGVPPGGAWLHVPPANLPGLISSEDDAVCRVLCYRERTRKH